MAMDQLDPGELTLLLLEDRELTLDLAGRADDHGWSHGARYHSFDEGDSG